MREADWSRLKRIGRAAGIDPDQARTPEDLTLRIEDAIRGLRRSAGITWADYELAKVDKGAATFGLRKPPESSPLGGPRWVIRVGEPLDELAGRLGLYEDNRP